MLWVMAQETSKDTPQNWQVPPKTASMPHTQVGLAYLEPYSVQVEVYTNAIPFKSEKTCEKLL